MYVTSPVIEGLNVKQVINALISRLINPLLFINVTPNLLLILLLITPFQNL